MRIHLSHIMGVNGGGYNPTWLLFIIGIRLIVLFTGILKRLVEFVMLTYFSVI